MIRIFLYISIIVCVLLAVSFRWPVSDATITSTFCESRWDHFHDGIDMISADGKVYPVEPGTLLFYWDKSLFPLENYPGGGNYKILEHRGGLYSVYMHLENGISSKKTYAADQPLGLMGDTGHSGSKHIHFSIIDIKKQVSLNPFKLLPPFQDDKAPNIADIAFHIGDKYVIVRDKSNIRLTKNYPLLIKISDSMKGRENCGIYRLLVECNSKKVFEKEYNEISYAKNRLTIGGKAFDALFDKKGFYKVEGIVYAEGDNVIKITAWDYAGNQYEKEYGFYVKLDMEK